jgi:hypothetical protein
MQDNGLREILPSGEGMFLVDTVEEASVAIETVMDDPNRHALAARAIAEDYLDTPKVLGRFLAELGLPTGVGR